MEGKPIDKYSDLGLLLIHKWNEASVWVRHEPSLAGSEDRGGYYCIRIAVGSYISVGR